MQIFIHRDDQEYGPYSLDQIKGFLADGNITGDDYCRVDDDAEWSTVSARLGYLLPPPPPAVMKVVPPIPEKKKPGCWKIGCLGLGAIPALLIFLLILGLILPKPPPDPNWDRGWDAGEQQGAVDYSPGASKPSDEETSAYARQLLSSPEYKDYTGDTERFITGYESGYSHAWNDAKSRQVNGQ